MYTQFYTSVNEYYIYTHLHTALHMPHASIFHRYTHLVLSPPQVSSPMTVEVVTDTSQNQVRSPVDFRNTRCSYGHLLVINGYK